MERISEAANQPMTSDESSMHHATRDTRHEVRVTQHAAARSLPVGRITGSTHLAGVIGWPVSHSLSPRMHNAAYAALGLDWAYLPLPVPPERVGDAVRGLVALGFTGANVTVPHKQAVIPFMDELTPIASAIGAVNTIVIRPDGSLLGDGTDCAGFMADLRAQMANGRWQTGTVLVIGAGGAARAVVYALAEAGASIAIVNRTLDHAQGLCQTLATALPDVAGRLSAHPFPNSLTDLAAEADLIVNTTSLGLHEGDPIPWDATLPFRPGQVVYDLIYNRPTELLALARSQGAIALGGLGMLVHQGARSAALWTGEDEVELARLMKKELLIP
jgi:shikimate dehydrogenase